MHTWNLLNMVSSDQNKLKNLQMEGGKFAFKAEGKYLTAKDIYSTDIEL